MRKMHYLVLIVLFVFSVVTFSFLTDQMPNVSRGKLIFVERALLINLEIAKTEKQRRTGLMHRDKLVKNSGMLFVFEQENVQRVWMKDTLISLDVIFISEQNKVVSFFKSLTPCKKKGCDIYTSTEKAKYMLEVNAGLIEREGIEIGQKVRLAFSL